MCRPSIVQMLVDVFMHLLCNSVRVSLGLCYRTNLNNLLLFNLGSKHITHNGESQKYELQGKSCWYVLAC